MAGSGEAAGSLGLARLPASADAAATEQLHSPPNLLLQTSHIKIQDLSLPEHSKRNNIDGATNSHVSYL